MPTGDSEPLIMFRATDTPLTCGRAVQLSHAQRAFVEDQTRILQEAIKQRLIGLRVGRFQISQMPNGNIWIETATGEAMEAQVEQFEQAIQAFYDEQF